MSNASAIQMVGNWDTKTNNGLQAALKVIVGTTNKTLPMAVAKCMVMMAQTTSKLTAKSKKNRPIMRAEHNQQFVEVFNQKSEKRRMYKFQFDNPQKTGLKATWDEVKRIGNKGMAKRSWFWGLRGLPGAPYAMGGKPYPGVARLMKLVGSGSESFGMVLENRLSYILSAVPADYEAQAVMRTGNRIMKDAAKKLETEVGANLNQLKVT